MTVRADGLPAYRRPSNPSVSGEDSHGCGRIAADPSPDETHPTFGPYRRRNAVARSLLVVRLVGRRKSLVTAFERRGDVAVVGVAVEPADDALDAVDDVAGFAAPGEFVALADSGPSDAEVGATEAA